MRTQSRTDGDLHGRSCLIFSTIPCKAIVKRHELCDNLIKAGAVNGEKELVYYMEYVTRNVLSCRSADFFTLSPPKPKPEYTRMSHDMT